MKASLSSKSLCWTGTSSSEYLVTLFSLKRANLHSIHTVAFCQATGKPVFSQNLKSEQYQTQKTGGCVLLWLCLPNCCSYRGNREVKVGLGQVLSCLIGQNPQSGNLLFSTVYSFGEFGVFNFLIPSNLPP